MTNKSCDTQITAIIWGQMEVNVNGQLYKFKDCKVWPNGAKAWDWNLTGTRHRPGIQPADIAELLDKGIDVLVMSRGMELVLQTCPETIEQLKAKGIEYYLEETRDAVALFNRLVKEGRNVAGIFHSTC